MTDMTANTGGVGEARDWANHLIATHHRGPGDTVDAAMHRAARKHGLDPKMLWRLRYRSPKDMLVSTWKSIKAAYDAECERQEAKLRHELEITRALPSTMARARLIAATEALLAELDREEVGPLAEPTPTQIDGE